ncbi:MAG: universal stress protein, partial [Thiobacillus sp.]|nr:universal stress protein [Thiobacillus sp.]
MFKRILVAVDGSDTAAQALLEAINLAKEHHAQLRIVRKRPAAPPVVSRSSHAILPLFWRDTRWRSGMGRNSGECILKPGVGV